MYYIYYIRSYLSRHNLAFVPSREKTWVPGNNAWRCNTPRLESGI